MHQISTPLVEHDALWLMFVYFLPLGTSSGLPLAYHHPGQPLADHHPGLPLADHPGQPLADHPWTPTSGSPWTTRSSWDASLPPLDWTMHQISTPCVEPDALLLTFVYSLPLGTFSGGAPHGLSLADHTGLPLADLIPRTLTLADLLPDSHWRTIPGLSLADHFWTTTGAVGLLLYHC